MEKFSGHSMRSDRFTIRYGEWGSDFHIILSGALRLGDSAETFETVVASAITSNKPVLMDLGELQTVDSRGLGALVASTIQLEGRLTVTRLARRIKDILVLCRLLTAMPVGADR